MTFLTHPNSFHHKQAEKEEEIHIQTVKVEKEERLAQISIRKARRARSIERISMHKFKANQIKSINIFIVLIHIRLLLLRLNEPFGLAVQKLGTVVQVGIIARIAGILRVGLVRIKANLVGLVSIHVFARS